MSFQFPEIMADKSALILHGNTVSATPGTTTTSSVGLKDENIKLENNDTEWVWNVTKEEQIYETIINTNQDGFGEIEGDVSLPYSTPVNDPFWSSQTTTSRHPDSLMPLFDDASDELIISIPSDSGVRSITQIEQGEVPIELSSDLAEYLEEHFPDENDIELELEVDDFDSSDLALTSPLKYQGTFDPFYYQVYGMDEDKSLPQVELPMVDGPSYEPRIIPCPKKITRRKAKRTRSSATTKRIVKKNGHEFPSSKYGTPTDNQENVPVGVGSRINKKRNRTSRNEEDILRFIQRQEVVEAKNLRPRPWKTSQVIESPVKTPKPKREATRKKRGRPPTLRNLPSSTPLAVKVENTDFPLKAEAGDSTPLKVSPIKLLRRLPTSYKLPGVKEESSTLTASSPNLSVSSGYEPPYNIPKARSGYMVPSFESEPETTWFNPTSTYLPNPKNKKLGVLIVDVKAGSTESHLKRQTNPATVVFSRKSSTTPSFPIKTQNDDSPGCSVKLETFSPNFENPIKTEQGYGFLNNFINDKGNPCYKPNSTSYPPQIKPEPSSIDSIKALIKEEPRNRRAPPRPPATRSSLKKLEKLIKNEGVYLVPNPKAKFAGEMRPVRKRARYAKEEYVCALCPYKCTVESALYNHIAYHLEHTWPQTMFSCDICGLDTTSENNRALHMMHLHKEECDYKCDWCNFKTGQLKKLVQHRRKHTGERPHCCNLCGYRSTRRDNLHSHARRIHHIPRMEGDTFTQPEINWADIKKLMATDNNDNDLFQSFE